MQYLPFVYIISQVLISYNDYMHDITYVGAGSSTACNSNRFIKAEIPRRNVDIDGSVHDKFNAIERYIHTYLMSSNYVMNH